MYDVIVLGGGPGGYLAAERAGQAGLKTLLIEGEHLGGTCLNEGCIPTKTMLHSAKMYTHAVSGAYCGVTAENVRIDHSTVIDRKERVVQSLVNGVASAIKASHVEVVKERGTILGREDGEYIIEAGQTRYAGKNLIIATGSVCVIPPIEGLEESLRSGFALTNREMLSLRKPPRRLVVAGGGVIGLEMASYYQMTGSDVTVVEMMDHIAGSCDKDLAQVLHKKYIRQGMKFQLGARVSQVGDGKVICRREEETFEIEADNVLLAIGRAPNSKGFGLESLGILMDGAAIKTNRQMKTNLPGVYAVGDVNGKYMLAHTAYREAEVAVNTILGKRDAINYSAIPSVLYTVPELSSVGLTEEEARAQGLDAVAVKIPMAYSGRYVAENEDTDGVFKLVIDRKLKTVIGAQALANYSSEFIAAIGILIEMALPVEWIQKQIFPHPTVSEIIREAACQYNQRS